MLAGLLALMTAITPGPAPLHYKVELKTGQEADLSAMGGPKQQGDVTVVAFLSVTMSDSGAGQIAHVVVDSMTLTPTGMLTQAYDASLAGTAKGGFFHVYVVNGKAQGTPKPSIADNAAISVLGQAVTMLFPGTKAGAKAGDTFADTATSSVDNPQGTQHTTTVTTWTVKGTEGDALVFEGTSDGKLTMDGGQMAATGTNKGKRSMTSTVKGPVKKASLEGTMDLAVVPAGMSDPIPVKGTSSVTITQIN